MSEGVDRRTFLACSALTGAALTARGPWGADDFPIPADKHLDPAWVRSLTERGTPTTYSWTKKELGWIGMPIGGIACGQLYLGGDGHTWLWDVFNQPPPPEFCDCGGPHYAKPAEPSAPLEQGFQIFASAGARTFARRLDAQGFADVRFRGQYPLAHVDYADPELPFRVELEAWSPFVPLWTDDSSLPATVFEITVENTSAGALDVELLGWLENKTALATLPEVKGTRRNWVTRPEGCTLLQMEALARPEPPRTAEPLVLQDAADFGTMALGLLTPMGSANACADMSPRGSFKIRPLRVDEGIDSDKTYGESHVGGISTKARLSPGAKARFTFVIAWHFAGLRWDALSFLPEARKLRRHYAERFQDAAAVVRYVVENFERLASATHLWHETFYGRSSLPHWLLERSFANLSTLATATCLRFSNGRFWAWEGTNACPGTCTHVWQYAQGVARIFPELERDARARTDFGTSFHADTGLIDYRGEAGRSLAIDGQCGTILRALREHLMSKDKSFLEPLWPRVKKALELVIARDADQDGLLDGEQYNTLDTSWWGKIAWISSLYIAALRAGEALASEMGDAAFAAKCSALAEKGSQQMVAQLFDGECFVHKPDEAHPEANASGKGCHADQLLGQSFAHQLGLPRIVPEREARSALASLWKYNFAPDVGPYRAWIEKRIAGGRWYALPGEGGLVMCTWPHGGHERAAGQGPDAWAAGYFNECWTGCEHQVAAHMLREGMVTEGLALERTVHERYRAAKRNPWNEIECSDHYARALASYGVYLAACGYEYHGPRGHIGFAPRLTPERFQAAFTAAEGWGTYTQARATATQTHRLEIVFGRLRLTSLSFELPEARALAKVEARFEPALPVQAGDQVLRFERSGARVVVHLKSPADLTPGQEFVVVLRS